MTEQLFREDAYRKECTAKVVSAGDEGVVFDRTIFYPTGGGQPGDIGTIFWDGYSAKIVDTRNGHDGAICHALEPGSGQPEPGTTVDLSLDWDRRHRHMRMHTAMHLLGSVLQYGVTGGSISYAKSRLDFDMQEGVDKEQVTSELQALVNADYPISHRWISDAELEAQPELVRTLSVRPPKGAGLIRLLEIKGLDLQPCGGTHVKSTAEVGSVRVSKVENKGRHNRRVHIVLDG
jgi:misacylated tRNA(Ala) deacylase